MVEPKKPRSSSSSSKKTTQKVKHEAAANQASSAQPEAFSNHETVRGSTPDGQNVEANFSFQRVYIKQCRFEVFGAPEIFREEFTNPSLDMKIDVTSHEIDEGLFEVTLIFMLGATANNLDLYDLKIDVAGIFAISGIPNESIDKVLEIYCSSVLFPYAREYIDNILVKATLPPIMLAQVNFEAVYRAKIESQQKKQSNSVKKDFTPKNYS